jgi:hypothetical protein
MRLAHALAALALAACLSAAAAVPTTISYQGYLTSGGVPVNSTVNLTVNLYSNASGGPSVWAESHNGVAVANGIYNIVLGGSNPLDENILNGQLYLGVTVAPDAEMVPRMPLTSAPYAIRAKALDVTLDVGGGGTGLTSAPAGGLLYGQGAGALGVTGAGSAGQVLTATAGGVPQWSNSTGAAPLTISHPAWIVLQGATFDSNGIDLPSARVLSIGGSQVVGSRQPGVASAAIASGYDVGDPNSRFGLSSGCDGATVTAGNTCSITVTYIPGNPGSNDALLTLTSTASNSPHRVHLSTVFLASAPQAGAVSVSHSALSDFTTVNPQVVTFTNTTGGVIQFGTATTSAQVATTADFDALVMQFNALLERLRNHGLIEP